uniref:Uncharacterized protein n=1 Tax=Heterorhabditis bacteriophora TaxID=37862 RepID=A0A1I7XDF6_HETBA
MRASMASYNPHRTTPVRSKNLFSLPPPYTITTEEPPVFNARTGKLNAIRLEWIPHSTSIAMCYIAVAVSSLFYYALCFAYNFERIPLEKRKPEYQLFTETSLLHVVCAQWILVFSIFIACLFLQRFIPMPLHIFLSIIASNGSCVLFAINVRKVYDGQITVDCPYFLLTCTICSFALVHCALYLLALFYERTEHKYCSPARSEALHYALQCRLENFRMRERERQERMYFF